MSDRYDEAARELLHNSKTWVPYGRGAAGTDGFDVATEEISQTLRQFREDALEDAAKLADVYADVNIESAGDSIIADPILHGDAPTVSNLAKSENLQVSGTIHSSMFHAAQNIAEAIRTLKIKP